MIGSDKDTIDRHRNRPSKEISPEIHSDVKRHGLDHDLDLYEQKILTKKHM